MYPDPQNEMQARFSMPYCLSLALHSGRPTLSDFTPASVARPEIRRLMPLIKMEGRKSLPATTRRRSGPPLRCG